MLAVRGEARGRPRFDGIELIGGYGGQEMEESIERSAVFREIERGTSREMAADLCDRIAGVEQQYSGQHQGQGLHVLAHFDRQHQFPFELGRCARIAETALIAEALAGKVLGELLHGRTIMDIAGGELDRHDFIVVIEHQMQLTAEASAHGVLAARSQAGEGFMPVEAATMDRAGVIAELKHHEAFGA